MSLNSAKLSMKTKGRIVASSTTTPLWGPQLPRIPRVREQRYYSKIKYVGNQSRNGITLVEAPWQYTVVRNPRVSVERCEDTIRNPKFKPFAAKNFHDDGGPLKITHSRWEFADGGNGITTPWNFNTRSNYGLVPVLVAISDGGFDPVFNAYPPNSDVNFSSYHAKAYSLMKPNAPIIDLFTFVAEIRDLAGLTFKSIRNIKDISDWWLAVNFGWKPLLADILKMVKAIQQIDKRLQFLIANNGLPVRRRVGTVFEASNTSVLYSANNIGINVNTAVQFNRPQLTSAWKISVTRNLRTKVWASARFIYWMRDLEKLQKVQLRVKLGLLGMNPTPASVWNALPWSWLIDWLSNIGDILQNMSSQAGERLTADYFYVMGNTHRSYTWTGTDGYFTCSTSHIYESKCREIGHPYGLAFGSNLTTLQYSILAALAAQKF